jgi:thiol-disulfide isomerase/thioredoxin
MFFPKRYNPPNLLIIGMILFIIAVLLIVFLMRSSKEETKQTFSLIEEIPPSIPLANGRSKPSLVLFYADWCGYSKKILPTWDLVRATLTESGSVDVFDFEEKRDALQVMNAIKLPEFRGFPDIRFYPQGYPEDPAILYTGDRGEESLLKFAYTGGAMV